MAPPPTPPPAPGAPPAPSGGVGRPLLPPGTPVLILPGEAVSFVSLEDSLPLPQGRTETTAIVDGAPAVVLPDTGLAVSLAERTITALHVGRFSAADPLPDIYYTPGGVRWGSPEKDVAAEFGPPMAERPASGGTEWVYPGRGIRFLVVDGRVDRITVFAGNPSAPRHRPRPPTVLRLPSELAPGGGATGEGSGR